MSSESEFPLTFYGDPCNKFLNIIEISINIANFLTIKKNYVLASNREWSKRVLDNVESINRS